eukprot:Skav208284  [mRNA]  locus=scaffold897:13238:13876:+ [translate_table: standard]
MISFAGKLCFFLRLFTAYSAPVQVPYVPEIDVGRDQTVSRESGACRLSGLVEFSSHHPGRYGLCSTELCQSLQAAMSPKLSNGEEVNVYEFNQWNYAPGNPMVCSYIIAFNSTTAMEAAGIREFLRKKEFFSEHLSRHFNFSSRADDSDSCRVPAISRVTEPVTSFIAATTSVAHWRVGKKTMDFDFKFDFNPRADLPAPPISWPILGGPPG